MVYNEEGASLQNSAASHAKCPCCDHLFCVDCRCPAHPSIDCEAAMKHESATSDARRASRKSIFKNLPAQAVDSSQQVTVRDITIPMEGGSILALRHVTPPRGRRDMTPPRRDVTPRRRDLTPSRRDRTPSRRDVTPVGSRFVSVDLEDMAQDRGWKFCPRCRCIVEKADSESCSHMTCLRCRFEFCWNCSADRSVIAAHGNHFHRPSCEFYAPFAGRDDFLPQRCVKCRLRGVACRPMFVDHTLMPPGACVGDHYVQLVDMCVQWFHNALLCPRG